MDNMTVMYRETPYIESSALTRILQKPVYLKLENLQPSGSFKNRGIGLLCQECVKEGVSQLITVSGGNAGLAVAYSGRLLNRRVTVVLPEITPAFMVQKIEQEGAKVIKQGKNFDEAYDVAKNLVENTKGAKLIPPFDHPLIWQGHASLVREMAKQGQKPGVIVLAVGGGGLLCGVVEGLRAVGWCDVPVIGVEPEGANAFARSLKEGKLVTLEAVNTICGSLASKKITPQVLVEAKTHKILSHVVSDRQAAQAALRFADLERILVEPACGVALSAVFEKDPILSSFSSVAVVVCGGNVVNLSLLSAWQKQFY